MKTHEETNNTFEKIDEIINWTLPGLTMYYRDSNLRKNIIDQYEIGKIFRAQTFVDVSNYAGRPATNCRFLIASSKAAPLYKFNPETEKWRLHVLNCNSYFKVLDVYEKEGITQIFLIHIPFKGIDFFRNTVLKIGDENFEEEIIIKSRASLDKKLNVGIPAALNQQEWIDRTSFPIGLDNNNIFFSLIPTEPLLPKAQSLYLAIKNMTEDLTELNETLI
jgi:hypothetical protein